MGLIGQPMNMVDWFNYYSFDVMGDLGFGKSFDSLAQGDMHWATQILTQGLGAFGLDMPDWLFRLLFDIPGLAGEYKSFVKFACQQLDKRMQRQSKTDTPASHFSTLSTKKMLMCKQDIAHVLIDHVEKNAGDKREALLFLQVDTRLIIQAGSDTTTSALIHMFFYMASDPQKQDEIRREVKAAYSDGKAQALQDAPLLNGTISEALRLHPPVSSGLLRVTPSEGINIGEVFIPGDAVIRFPQYVMGHGACYRALLPIRVLRACRRSELYPRRNFYPRAVVVSARTRQEQGRLCPIFSRSLQLYRQESGVFGTSSAHHTTADEVQCCSRSRRRRDDSSNEKPRPLYTSFGSTQIGVYQEGGLSGISSYSCCWTVNLQLFIEVVGIDAWHLHVSILLSARPM